MEMDGDEIMRVFRDIHECTKLQTHVYYKAYAQNKFVYIWYKLARVLRKTYEN